MKYIGHLFSLLYRIGLQLTILGMIIFVIVLAMFYTNPGAKLSIGLMNLFLPYPIHVQDVEGILAGPLTLKKVSSHNPQFSFSADTLTADWSEGAYKSIRKSINLKQLKANNIKIVYHDTSQEWTTEIPSLTTLANQLQKILTVQLIIEDFQANTISVQVGEKPIDIESLTFTRGASHQNHLFKTLNIQAKQGILLFDQHDKYINLQWDFKIAELNQFIPSLKGDILTRGTLKLHDINQIDHDTIIKLTLESKQLSYLDNQIKNLVLEGSGNFDKHHLDIHGNFNDYQIDTNFIGNLDKLTKSYWKIDLKKLDLHHKRFGKLPTSVGKITLQRDTTAHTIQSNIDINILGENIMHAKLKVDTHPDSAYALLGQIQGDILDLDCLVKLFPELEDVHGQAKLNLTLQGDVFNPSFGGNVTLSNLTIDSSELNNLSTNLHISVLNLESTGDGKLNITGKGSMGKGSFTIEGISDFTQKTPLVDLSLKGSMLTLSQTPEYFIIANPTLRLQLKDNVPQLTGNIFIPNAEIETQVFAKDIIQPSNDMIVVNNLAEITPSNHINISKKPIQNDALDSLRHKGYAPLVTNINIELGNHIRYKGFGLQSHVIGKLNIFTQNSNLHARGKLSLVNGKYRTHGNTLDIQQGQIAFLGDQISNPTWDIRAVKQIYTPIQNKLFTMPKKGKDTVLFDSGNNTMTAHKPILVGISLKGTVQEPVLKMFSVPTMKEADIISYLVLNKPQRDASEAQTTLVLEAANELITFLGNKRHDVKLDLAKNLKLDKFGLNQIESNMPGQNDLKQTAFVIGKHLSNKLYAEYSLRVLDTASAVSLRYLLGKHITLQASASKESASGDILFTFESG